MEGISILIGHWRMTREKGGKTKRESHISKDCSSEAWNPVPAMKSFMFLMKYFSWIVHKLLNNVYNYTKEWSVILNLKPVK